MEEFEFSHETGPDVEPEVLPAPEPAPAPPEDVPAVEPVIEPAPFDFREIDRDLLPQEAAPSDEERICNVCDRSFNAYRPGERCESRPMTDSLCCPHDVCHATSSLPARS